MPELKDIYTNWFRQYGLRLVSDRSSQSLKILKDRGDEVFLLPYSSVADTLQRIIFYKTAVASNENSVLLFEEPEAHAYPPYISEFTQEVIKSTTNQFFIVTHSPLIVNDFLEGAIDDLGIYMVDFKDGQTAFQKGDSGGASIRRRSVFQQRSLPVLMELNVIPECYIDTKLVKIAAPPQSRYNHQKGCPNVLKIMQERLPDKFALGIIDRDKKILAYTGAFELIYEIPDALQLFRHPDRHHYLIFVLPAVEKWVLLGAEEVNLSLTEFGLPHDLKKLCDITKTSKSENDDPYSANLTQLFSELKRRNPIRMQVLALWVTYLKHNPYTASMAQLVADTNTLVGS